MHATSVWALAALLPQRAWTDAQLTAAYLIFIGSYVVFAVGKLPGLKIDRPGMAIIGSVLLVAFRLVGAQEALRSIVKNIDRELLATAYLNHGEGVHR